MEEVRRSLNDPGEFADDRGKQASPWKQVKVAQSQQTSQSQHHGVVSHVNDAEGQNQLEIAGFSQHSKPENGHHGDGVEQDGQERDSDSDADLNHPK